MKTILVVVLLNYYLGGLYKVDYDRQKPGSQNYYLIGNTGKKKKKKALPPIKKHLHVHKNIMPLCRDCQKCLCKPVNVVAMLALI